MVSLAGNMSGSTKCWRKRGTAKMLLETVLRFGELFLGGRVGGDIIA